MGKLLLIHVKLMNQLEELLKTAVKTVLFIVLKQFKKIRCDLKNIWKLVVKKKITVVQHFLPIDTFHPVRRSVRLRQQTTQKPKEVPEIDRKH